MAATEQERSAIAQSIREAREAAGLSKIQLAEKAGLSRSGIGRIESGKRSPTGETLAALAGALDGTFVVTAQGMTFKRGETQ